MACFCASLLVFARPSAAAQDQDCNKCHEAMSKGKVLHAAMKKGCSACHENPHASKDKATLSLKADQPDLCYDCHSRGLFLKQYQHKPIGTSKCTSCHNPHSSNNVKLLTTAMPDLCYKCHDKKIAAKKNVHFPTAAGLCMFCHEAHSSDNSEKLLTFSMPELCFRCHDKASVADKRRDAASTGNLRQMQFLP